MTAEKFKQKFPLLSKYFKFKSINGIDYIYNDDLYVYANNKSEKENIDFMIKNIDSISTYKGIEEKKQILNKLNNLK